MEKLDFTHIYAQNSVLMYDFKPLFFFSLSWTLADLSQELLERLKLGRDFLGKVMKNDKTYEKSPPKNQTSLT